MKLPVPVFEIGGSFVYVMEADGDAPPGWVSLKQHNGRPTPWTGYFPNWGAGDRYLSPIPILLQGDGDIWGVPYYGAPVYYNATADTYSTAYGWVALERVASSAGYSEYGYNALHEWRVALPNASGIPPTWRIFSDNPHGYPFVLDGRELFVVPVYGFAPTYLRNFHNVPDNFSNVWVRK